MPTSHDCEDDECVNGSAISPATVYMCMFWGLIVFEDEHQVVHVCIDLSGHYSIDQCIWNQSVLSDVSWLLWAGPAFAS